MIVLFAIIEILITVIFCGIGHLILIETILEVGYGNRSGRKAKKLLKKQPLMERIFVRTLVSNATKKQGVVGFYYILLILDVIAFIAGVVANCLAVILWNGDIILYGGIGIPFCWLLLMIMIMFIPDLLFVPSERKRYVSDDPFANAATIIMWSIMIIGGILMIIKN